MKQPNPSLSLSMTLLLSFLWPSGSWGTTLSDPTRPPAVWLAAQGITLPGSQRDAPSGLQLILIGESRKFAIINGQIVKPGKLYNGSRVIDIKSDGVVVRDRSKSLKLIPSVKKSVITSDPPKKSRSKARKSKKSANENGENQ